MRKVLIIDTVCPTPYTSKDIEKGIGGTEATVSRIAEALSEYDLEIEVAQHNRKNAEVLKSCAYVPLSEAMRRPDVVVVIRTPVLLDAYRKLYPDSRMLLWAHDLIVPAWRDREDELARTKTELLCVSQFHKQQAEMELYDNKGRFKINYIYNPVVATKTGESADPYKLVFLSNPMKGLEETLKAFQRLHTLDPKYKLFVAYPNYCADVKLPDGVVNLGSLPQKEIHKHVEQALCVFSLNQVYPETFGLSLAEANALGTPVITYPIGAAREVLSHPSELVLTRSYVDAIRRVQAWNSGERPIVGANTIFKLETIVRQWKRLIAG